MPAIRTAIEDMRFLLRHVLDLDGISGDDSTDLEMWDAALIAIDRVAQGELAPLNSAGDHRGGTTGRVIGQPRMGAKSLVSPRCGRQDRHRTERRRAWDDTEEGYKGGDHKSASFDADDRRAGDRGGLFRRHRAAIGKSRRPSSGHDLGKLFR
jgi:hypothetical protein